MRELTDQEIDNFDLATGEDLLQEDFPELGNLSSAFLFQFIPKPVQTIPPEFVYIPYNGRKGICEKDGALLKRLTITQWKIYPQ